MFFHSLAVIGTPVDQTLALKISHARVFWVPVMEGAQSAALGSEWLRTARNEYGRVWTEGFGEPWRTKKYGRADRSIATGDDDRRRWRESRSAKNGICARFGDWRLLALYQCALLSSWNPRAKQGLHQMIVWGFTSCIPY